MANRQSARAGSQPPSRGSEEVVSFGRGSGYHPRLMDHFQYRGPGLHCEELPLAELAREFGTPLYVYSYATLERHYRAFEGAFRSLNSLICYAVKANGNLAVLRAVANWGGGADVASGGELFRCLEAGFSPRKIVFSGVGKSLAEIEYALRTKILFLNVESAGELRTISRVAKAMDLKAPVAMRLNPDVDSKTHPYIATGLKENKFGLPRQEILELFREAQQDPHLDPVGLALHIGSQITELTPFLDALKIALDFIHDLRSKGIPIEILDFGGGLGVTYTHETPPSPEEYASAIAGLLKGEKLRVIIEPGRAMVANTGVLLTRVLHLKRNEAKTFVIVDAAMNDLIRPSLYGAEHEIVPVTKTNRPAILADIVGPVCETSDFLGKARRIQEPEEGDLLCVRTAGAYGFSMASQYNARPRPAEILVRGSQVDLVRARESFDDLIRGENIPDWLKGSP
ncbi:MAG: diaminopimelate decarboxylase [Pseudomonadota bacterium]